MKLQAKQQKNSRPFLRLRTNAVAGAFSDDGVKADGNEWSGYL